MISSVRGFLGSIVDNFGWSFALMLVSVYAGLKGFISQMASSAQLPYFQRLGITGEKYQSYGTVAVTPWAMKAAMGLLSDTVPFLGYHKRSYILLVSIVGTVAFAFLSFLSLTSPFAPLAALLLFVGNLQMAMVDLLCEGKYAELMVQKPHTGSDMVTYVWGLYSLGSFAGSAIAGPMADHVDPKYIFLVCLPFAAQVIFPTAAGWLPEERLPPGDRGIRTEKIRKHPNLFNLSIAMTVGAGAVGISALLNTGNTQSIVSIITAGVLCALGSAWLPISLGRANLYMFLSSMLYVSLPGALDYWFTADDKCVPGGPHFSFTYYYTYASLVGSIAAGVGVAMFQRFLSRGKFRVAFWATSLVKLAASFFDIFIVMRLNRRLGIPDKLAFLLGDAVIFQVAVQLDFMPAVVLTSKVCPKGMEASVYALLASYQNLGSNVSRALGVALIDWLGIRTVVPCDFSKLPLAILIAHVILPLLVVPLVFVLIPNAKMTDNIVEGVEMEPGEGEFSPLPATSDEDDTPEKEEEQDLKRSVEKPFIKVKDKFVDDTEFETPNITGIPIEGNFVPYDKDDIDADSQDMGQSHSESLLSITPGLIGRVQDAGYHRDIPSSLIEEKYEPPKNNKE